MDNSAKILHGSELKAHWDHFIANGDQTIFKKIYLHYYHYFSFLGLKKGFSPYKIKDSLNEVFLYVCENREKLTRVENHHNYLVTAFLRKLYRKEKLVFQEHWDGGDLPEFMIGSSVESDYILKSNQQELTRVLDEFIAQLPARQKLMIYQKFYLGLSYDEIASANQISINTVYNTIYKAVDKLKVLIGQDQLQILSIAFAHLATFFLIFFIKH